MVSLQSGITNIDYGVGTPVTPVARDNQESILGALPPSLVQEDEEEQFVTPPGSPGDNLMALPLTTISSRRPSLSLVNQPEPSSLGSTYEMSLSTPSASQHEFANFDSPQRDRATGMGLSWTTTTARTCFWRRVGRWHEPRAPAPAVLTTAVNDEDGDSGGDDGDDRDDTDTDTDDGDGVSSRWCAIQRERSAIRSHRGVCDMYDVVPRPQERGVRK
ncbi:hypothetical protein B0F90DRAFT_1343865 [Multifurca ochricompacta]|uniref:Uncharacterized protein n=1 Tax=Multifurca ochricompacta TaxID=376703 RepID=A0AAD4QKF7_9AGAM|nr:hypothetical protein B0F90DRAFT_1343865 [Multifurca ochricompacta]